LNTGPLDRGRKKLEGRKESSKSPQDREKELRKKLKPHLLPVWEKILKNTPCGPAGKISAEKQAGE